MAADWIDGREEKANLLGIVSGCRRGEKRFAQPAESCPFCYLNQGARTLHTQTPIDSRAAFVDGIDRQGELVGNGQGTVSSAQ